MKIWIIFRHGIKAFHAMHCQIRVGFLDETQHIFISFTLLQQ